MDYDTNLTSTDAELEAAEMPFADGQLAYRHGMSRWEAPLGDRFNQRTDWQAGWDLENDAANAAYLRKIGAE